MTHRDEKNIDLIISLANGHIAQFPETAANAYQEIWPQATTDQRYRILDALNNWGRNGARIRLILDESGVNIYDPTV